MAKGLAGLLPQFQVTKIEPKWISRDPAVVS